MVKGHSPIAECKKATDIMIPSKIDCENPIDSILVSPKSFDKAEKVLRRRNCSKSRVTFFPTVTVKEIPHLEDYSQSIFEAIYLTPEDFAEIKSQVKVTLRLMMSNMIEDHQSDYCSRGLEVKTREGHKRRSLNKQRVRKAVLREQESQRETGLESAAFIAEVSMAHSKQSLLAARETAIRDAEEAIHCHCGL